MRVLLYLECRQLVNVLRLTARSPKRLVPIILIGVSVLPSIVISLIGGGRSEAAAASLGLSLRLDALHAVLYLVLALAGLYLIQRSFSASMITFSMPEIDVIVTTPISRRTVMAVKLAKLYAKTGAAYAFLLLFAGPTIAMLMERWSAKAMPVTWIGLLLYGVTLINVCTTINLMTQYASPKSAVWPRIVIRGAAYALLAFAALTVGIGYLGTGSLLKAVAALLHNPLIVALMLPAAWASNLAMAPAAGWVPALGWQLAGLGALACASYALVLRRRENPYEPSIEGSERLAAIREAMRSGDPNRIHAVMLEKRARSVNHTSVRPFGRGAAAVLWKNLVIGLRLWKRSLFSIAVMVVSVAVGLRIFMNASSFEVSPELILGGALYFVWMGSAMMLNGVRADLRQADTLRPIPIPAWQLMAAQTAHIGVANAALMWLVFSAALLFRIVSAEPVFLYAGLTLPFVAYGSVCAQLVTVVLYPNARDMSQQYIGAILGMLLSGIAIGPSVVIGVLFYYFRLSLPVGALLVILVSAAMAAAGIALGAAAYRRHDPTNE